MYHFPGFKTGATGQSRPLHPYLRRSTRYLLIALLPLLLCWVLILNQSREWAISFTKTNATNQLEKNCMLIEQRLDSFYQSFALLQNNSAFNELLLSGYEDTPLSRRIFYQKASEILNQHFVNFDSIYSLYLISPIYSDSFYNATALPQILHPENIAYYDTLSSHRGTILWFPTAHCADIIQINERYSKYYSDFEVISLGVQLEMSYVKNSYLYQYQGTQTPPVLLLNISPSLFDQWLAHDDTIAYQIYTSEGAPIYSTGNIESMEGLPVPLRSDLNPDGTFSSFYKNGLKGTFTCSRMLENSGWIVTSYTPINNTLKYLGTSISFISLLVICFTIILVFVILRSTMRSIHEPLTLLADGLAETAAGHYEHRIYNTKYHDYRPTFEAYNQMNQDINKLITENYEIKLSEKELEIQLINLQFNPHFLYNMLNICSLMALEADQTEISDILSKLSYMMRYSVKTTSPFVPFQEDLKYVEAYIAAMLLRTNHSFTYESDLDPDLGNPMIPKFLLQPFVENAVHHGFDKGQPTFTYHLCITARRQEQDLIFTVEDNGKGIQHDIYDSLWSKDSSGIGIANTHKRIQLYYGANYGVQIQTVPEKGTLVTVRIPYQENNMEKT